MILLVSGNHAGKCMRSAIIQEGLEKGPKISLEILERQNGPDVAKSARLNDGPVVRILGIEEMRCKVFRFFKSAYQTKDNHSGHLRIGVIISFITSTPNGSFS
jgi:hypothetical protein